MTKLVFPALVYQKDHPRLLMFMVPTDFVDWLNILEDGKQYCVTIDKPRKPRTTGPKSQSAHFHGHCRQIAEFTGHEVDEIKMEVKRRAMKRGYPPMYDEAGKVRYSVLDGRALPKSEAEADTQEESWLIEEAHSLGDFVGITLREE